MAQYPSSIDSFPVPVSGTTLTNNSSFDHGTFHNLLGSAVGTIEKLLGTNSGVLSTSFNFINDSVGNHVIQPFSGGTNYWQIDGNSTGNPVQMFAVGGDTNIGMEFTAKGTAEIDFFGTTINLTSSNTQIFGTTYIQKGTIGGTSVIITPVVKTEVNLGNIGTGNFTVDWSKGDRQFGTVNSANGTVVFSNAQAGQVLTLWIYEDATGTRPINLPTIKWPGTTAPTFGTAASNVNSIVVRYDGSNYYGNSSVAYG